MNHMPHLWHILLDIVLLLGAAMLLGAIFERLKQNAIVGYLLAGALLGPYALSLVSNHKEVSELSELGVTLLLFAIGLEFSWSRLSKLGTRIMLAGVIQIVVTIFIISLLIRPLLQTAAQSLAIGAIAALSSTAIVLPTLARRAELDSVHGRMAMGILLLQDMAVVPLVLFIVVLDTGGGMGDLIYGSGRQVFMIMLFIAGFFLFNRYLLPSLISFATSSGNRDLPILFAIVVAMGSAWLAHRLGLSAALGAFIAGVFLGESVMSTRLRGDIGPLKTVFVTLFFAAIGMYADPVWIGSNVVLVASLVVAVVVVKAMVIWLVGVSIGMSHRYALAAGFCLAQVGEFSFVLTRIAAGIDSNQGLIDQNVFKTIISVTITTLVFTPYLISTSMRIGKASENLLRRFKLHTQLSHEPDDLKAVKLTGHCIVIGCGPAGQVVARSLQSRKQQVVMIDLNPRLIASVRAIGMIGIVGDGSSTEAIELASVAHAKAVIITLPDHRLAIQVIQAVRAMAPSIHIIVRARYSIYVDELKNAGAYIVINEETNVGEAISNASMMVGECQRL